MSQPEVLSFTPILKSVTVKATPERAFQRFTAELSTWWPLRSHSVGEHESETVVMEGRVGGQIVEHICGRSRRHSPHSPQEGVQDSATWSPGRTRVTPSPTASTTPEPSCPSTTGHGVPVVPSTAL